MGRRKHRPRGFVAHTERFGTAPNDSVPEYMPTFGLDRQIAQARAEMGEARWAELNAEWARCNAAIDHAREQRGRQ